jgi:hypothetical protein
VFFTADTKQFTNSSLQDMVYPRIGSSMGPSGVFLSLMDNPRAVEVLYLGPGEINLPDDIKPASSTGVETPILVGSIVGSVVVGLAFLLVIIWIVYKRSRQGIVKLNMDPEALDDEEEVSSFEMISSTAGPRTISRDPSIQLTNISRSDMVDRVPYMELSPTNVSDERDDPDPDPDPDMNAVPPGEADEKNSVSDDVVSSLTVDDSEFVSRMMLIVPTEEAESFLNDSDASSIDDEMIQTLESLIRVDDWQGVTSDVNDDLSLLDENRLKDEAVSMDVGPQVTSLSSTKVMYEDVQNMLRSGQWEIRSNAPSREETDVSSTGLSGKKLWDGTEM